MDKYFHFIMLTILIVTVVMIVAPDIATATAIIVLIGNVLFISGYLHKNKDKARKLVVPANGFDTTDDVEKFVSDRPGPDGPNGGQPAGALGPLGAPEVEGAQQEDAYTNYMYTPEELNYNAFKRPYDPEPRSNIVTNKSVDALNVRLALNRERHQRQLEGIVSKNANFYKHHFEDELEMQERLPWWGQYEY